MSDTPLVSVVIPCYNSEKYLPDTIKSVLYQTFNNLEIIVVDDGSTDKTADIIKSYGSKVAGVFGENKGASAARNKGTELAKGEFIQYLDSDDILDSRALETRIKAFSKNEADVVYSNWQELKEDQEGSFVKGKVQSRSIQDVHSNIEIALFTEFWSPPAAYLFRRELVHKIGGFKEYLIYIQDARFALDAALHGGKFFKVPEIGAYYRIRHNGSLSKSNPVGFLQDVYCNTQEIESIWREDGPLDSERLKALADNYDYTARNLFEADFTLFKRNLNSLYRIDPGFRPTWPKVAGLLSTLLGIKLAAMIMRAFFPLNVSDNHT